MSKMLLNIKEVSEQTGFSEPAIWAKIQRGTWPTVIIYVGKSVRFRQCEIDEMTGVKRSIED